MNMVVAECRGNVGFLTLNRPEALNAINQELHARIAEVLGQWRDDAQVRLVVLRASAGRAFCAGADLRQLHALRQDGADAAMSAFSRYYDLFAELSIYPKPVMALMDGIAMGGGIGLGGHVRHRVVTERSVLAMPEVLIGLTPDAGGSWLLAQAPGHQGLRLALTAGRMTGSEAVRMGFADHLVRADDLPDLMAALPDGEIDAVLRRFAQTPDDEAQGVAAPSSDEISAIYDAPELAEILARLDASDAPWAKADIAALNGASPLSLLVTFEAWKSARQGDLAAAMANERRLVNQLVQRPDFAEGIRARVVDKDFSPRWQSSHIRDVSPDDLRAILSAPL